ncbi:MAG: hypothetical protein M1829_005546 [Trizodia sp. TS-e1964]|nr:MAG: hypothetical protein M1829_005546 [Trizodia sp. TS-e1964]
MSDSDLDQIRKARLAQLQQESRARPTAPDDSQAQQEDDARASILAQILDPAAADRLGRVRLVKEERALEVEDRLIMAARSGQLQQKVTEAQLKTLLGAVAEKKGEERIVVRRREVLDEDDE